MLKDITSVVPIILTLSVVHIGVVEEARVLDFLGGLDSGLVGKGMSNLIWPIYSIQISRIDFIC